MLENWIKDHSILKRISKHHKTGEPLSDELIAKINEVDKDHKGTETLF
jgi:Zn-dependent oligopeptidase